MKGDPKGGQHFIPRFYLRAFSYEKGENPPVWMHERGKQPKQLPVSQVGKRTHIYSTREKMNAERDVTNELRLREKETETAPIFRKVLQDKGAQNLTGDEAVLFGAFVLQMSLRTPNNFELADNRYRDFIIEQTRAVAQDDAALAQILEEGKKEDRQYANMDIEKIREVIEEGPRRENIVLSHSTGISEMWMSIGQCIPYIMQMNWAFVRPHDLEIVDFVTSDDPVVAMINDPHGERIIRGGWAQPTLEVAFPLSPRLCFVASWRSLNGRGVIGAETVRSFNHFTVMQSERFIYAAQERDDLETSFEERDYQKAKHGGEHEMLRQLYQ